MITFRTIPRLSPPSMTRGNPRCRIPFPPVIDRGLIRDHHGVTLSEVLVSLLVMSIGVIAVATLFPLSVLRTVQATQLTNAAQLRYNFEGMTGARPEIFAGAETWQPGKTYAVGDLVVGSSPSAFFYECTDVDNAGVAGSLEPQWASLGQTAVDNDITWTTRGARVFVVDPLGWQHRTEDLRDNAVTPAINSANFRNGFGRMSLAPNNSTVVSPNAPPYDSPYRIVRFRGGVPGSTVNPSSSTFFPPVGSALDVGANFGARQMAVLPDSWVLQTDSTDVVVPGAPVTTLQLMNSSSQLITTLDRDNDSVVDLRVSTPTAAERDISARVTLFDATGKYSYIRQLTGITSPSAGVEELTWTGELPGGFTPVRARVETFEARYSWMLAGRRNGPTSYLSLIVFFRRSSDPAGELIHPAHFNLGSWAGADNSPNTVDDVADLSVSTLGVVTRVLRAGGDGTLGTVDDITPKPLVVVRYNTAIAAGERPFLKKGGYICDSQNNRWYRILKFTEVADAPAAQGLLHAASGSALPTAATGSPGAIVWLDNPVQENSGIYNTDANASEPESFPGAILMPGIIDVYPLQPRLPWEN